jgi:hypothetical protein
VQVVTLVIAIWGALLSTFLAIRQVWLDRPRLVLSAWTEVHKISNEPLSHLCSVVVRVDNRGRRPMWINEVGWAHGRDAIMWRDSPTAHSDVRNRVDLPHLVDAGKRIDIPIWALADSWPNDKRTDLRAGVRSAGGEWVTWVDPEVRVTG